MLGEIKQKISELTANKITIKHNLSYHVRIVLKQLIDNKDLITQKADKGNTIVIQNRDDYVSEGPQ